jgi:TolB-like protein
MPGTAQLARFGVFDLDLTAGELCRNGRRVKLQEQSFRLLTLLLERPGDTVTRDQLKKALWPADTFVDFDHSLNAAIAKLRQLLGDRSESPRFIETVSRRGYRFVAPVEFLSAPSSVRRSGPSPRGEVTNSLAVLPFENSNGDPEMEYFSDGIAETIMNNLSQLRELRVVARTTAFRYKGRDADPRDVGRELNVTAVLTGKIIQRGESIRVQVELVDTGDGSQLWGERYDRNAADIFSIEKDIAREISQSLRLRLTREDLVRLARSSTDTKDAYHLYLKGRYHWNRRSIGAALPYLEAAVERDPAYALAWAGIANCYALAGTYEVLPPSRSVPRARSAAIKALQLDPSLAEPHAALAWVESYYDWDWVAGEREFEQAFDKHSDALLYWSAIPLLARGHVKEAVDRAKSTLELEPLSPIVNVVYGATLIHAGRYNEAVEMFRNAIELDPAFPLAQWALALGYEQQGMYTEAIAELENAQRLAGAMPIITGLLGCACAARGQTGRAEQALTDLEKQAKRQYVAPFDSALIHLGLGNADRAFECLAKACEDRSFWLIYFIRLASFFESRGSDPRYQAILRRMNLERTRISA